MPKKITNRLTVKSVAKLCEKGRYADGGGLYLQVSATGSKSWIYKFYFDGKSKEMGLGSLASISLAEARELASSARKIFESGQNPIEVKKIAALKLKNAASFGAYANKKLDLWEQQWKNEKYKYQRRYIINTLCKDIYENSFNHIETPQIIAVLEPIWLKMNVTAKKAQGLLKRVFDAAIVEGLRNGDNPARWTGHLEHLLPKQSRIINHHSAVPYAKIGAIYRKIRELLSSSAHALEFTILTASRTGEVIYAKFKEIDFETNTWIIPPERMKEPREHRVPLSTRARQIIDIMKQAAEYHSCPLNELYIFPGAKNEIIKIEKQKYSRPKPLSNMAMLECLQGINGYDKFTVHGFRSTFRDWIYEDTEYSRDLAEAALAHVYGDEVERAYRRGDALDRRRKLMQAWDDYIQAASFAVSINSSTDDAKT